MIHLFHLLVICVIARGRILPTFWRLLPFWTFTFLPIVFIERGLSVSGRRRRFRSTLVNIFRGRSTIMHVLSILYLRGIPSLIPWGRFWFSALYLHNYPFKLGLWAVLCTVDIPFLFFDGLSLLPHHFFAIDLSNRILLMFGIHYLVADHTGKALGFGEGVCGFRRWLIENVIDIAAIRMLVTHGIFYTNNFLFIPPSFYWTATSDL